MGVEVGATASGNLDALCSAADVVSGAAGVVKDVYGRSLTLLKLLHEHMHPDEENRPEGLDLQVAEFGPNADRLEGLVRDTVVSVIATSFVVLLGHGVPIEDSMVDSLPDYTDEQSARATRLARQL